MTSLSGIINDSFIRRFQGVAQGGSSGASMAKALTGQASKADISAGLRTGARTYSNAIGGINQVASMVNVSRASLEELAEITDKLINLATRATKSDAGVQTRQRIKREFNELAHDFQEILENAKIGDREYLTKDGLKEVFTVIGLDPGLSDSVASLFERFVTGEEDDTLASETIKGPRPVEIPPSAYMKSGSLTYTASQVSASTAPKATLNGAVTSAGTVYQATAPGQAELTIVDNNGTPHTVTSTNVMPLLAVNEATGYSVVQSTENFLGTNPGNFKQLFLVDNNAAVVRQCTSFGTNVTFTGASVSADNNTVAYSYQDGGTHYLNTITGAGPVQPIASGATAYSNPRISDDGNYLATYTTGVKLYSVAGSSWDPFLGADTTAKQFAFLDDGKLALTRDTDANGTEDTISVYSWGDNAFTDILTGLDIGAFNAIETGASGIGYFAYSSDADYDKNSIYVKQETGNAMTQYLGDPAGDSVSQLSLAYNATGGVDLGVYGVVTDITGQTDNEMYRFAAPPNSASRYMSRVTREAAEIFDGTFDITRRPDAYRILNDLKALREQIGDNLSACDEGMKLLQSTLDIVRLTGLAMLEVADSLKGDEDADKVAQKLRDKIRNSPAEALSQAENLNAIAAASLLLSGDMES